MPNPLAKRRPGRPSKLTPQVMTVILSAIKCGAPDKVACAAAGIRPATLCEWKNKAADRPKSEYAEFGEQLTRARQEGIAARLAIIQKAARNDWRAAAWLLERDMPDTFSLRFKIEHHQVEKPFTLADAFSRIREVREQKAIEGKGEIRDAEGC